MSLKLADPCLEVEHGNDVRQHSLHDPVFLPLGQRHSGPRPRGRRVRSGGCSLEDFRPTAADDYSTECRVAHALPPWFRLADDEYQLGRRIHTIERLAAWYK